MSEGRADKANRSTAPDPEPVLGLRQNLGQFSLLVLVNAFVGGMVGLERAILPLIAERGFGFVKALTNLAAGRFSDRIGRKGLLVAGRRNGRGTIQLGAGTTWEELEDVLGMLNTALR